MSQKCRYSNDRVILGRNGNKRERKKSKKEKKDKESGKNKKEKIADSELTAWLVMKMIDR